MIIFDLLHCFEYILAKTCLSGWVMDTCQA